uniref:Lipoprotein n=1 Tax=Burkholderia sp. (strain CCGE1003) TaxID=640512 RepID=E1TFA3_BURSG
MKLRLLMAVVSAILFLAPRAASADDLAPQPAVGTTAGASSGHRLMQHANESAQATTDIPLSEPAAGASPSVQNVAYGGVAAGRSEAGGRQNMPCSTGPQCRIYFGQ